MKNYYSILEVPETATADEIQSSYRRLAMKYHPDKGLKNSDKFREITEAYNGLKGNKQTPNPKKAARIRRGSDISVTLKVTLNEIVSEVSRTIVTTRACLCNTCKGSGSQSEAMPACLRCNGTGIDLVSSVVGPKKFCSYCKGYGNIAPTIKDCKKCSGTGLIKEKIQRSIKLSRKEEQGKITIKDSGNYPTGGGNPGDLILSFFSDNNNLFEITEKTIRGTISISPAQAVLGDTIFMDVLGNSTKVIVPPGTKSGNTIEQYNILIGTQKRNLYFKVSISIPNNPSEEEKNLYKQLLKIQKGYL